MKSAINLASAFCALLAAWFWFQSARVDIPTLTYAEAATNPMHIALRKAARMNAVAAGCAAAAALLQAFGLVLS